MAAVSLSRTWCRYVAGNVRQRALTGIVERSCRETHSSHTRSITRKFTTCSNMSDLAEPYQLAPNRRCVLILFASKCILSSLFAPPLDLLSLDTSGLSFPRRNENTHAGPFTGWGAEKSQTLSSKRVSRAEYADRRSETRDHRRLDVEAVLSHGNTSSTVFFVYLGLRNEIDRKISILLILYFHSFVSCQKQFWRINI